MVAQSDDPVAGNDVDRVRVSTPALELTPPARLGVLLEQEEGDLRITGFSEDSAARDAGLQTGDQLRAIDHERLTRLPDLRLALWRRVPGDTLTLTIARGAVEQTLVLTLR